jgi:hypothetical protein
VVANSRDKKQMIARPEIIQKIIKAELSGVEAMLKERHLPTTRKAKRGSRNKEKQTSYECQNLTHTL